MMRHLLPLALMMPCLAVPALAAERWPHFVRTGDDFVCQSAADKPAADETPCLAIGPLGIGMRRNVLELSLSKPMQQDKVGGRDYFGYVITTDDPMLQGTHLVMDSASVTYTADNKADSIQVTGEAMPIHWYFCGLELGAPEAALRARMGEPLQTSPANMPNTTLWTYSPNIAFGVRAGKIAFIQISKTTN